MHIERGFFPGKLNCQHFIEYTYCQLCEEWNLVFESHFSMIKSKSLTDQPVNLVFQVACLDLINDSDYQRGSPCYKFVVQIIPQIIPQIRLCSTSGV
jgi:hypothetical protein